MINCYTGEWQEGDRQVERGKKQMNSFLPKQKTGFDNHDWDLCTGRQAPINFKSKSKQNR